MSAAGFMRMALPVLALALCAAAIAAVVTQTQPTRYSSSVTMVVQTSAGANDTETLVRTMIALASSDVVGEALRERVGSSLPADEITASLSIERPPGSSVLTVSYVDTDADQSVATAQAMVPVFQEQVAALEAGQAGQLAPNYAIQSWGNGSVTTMAVPAPILRNAAIAALLGALLGGVGAALYRQRNPLVRSTEEAEELTRLPVVATPGLMGKGGRGQSGWNPTDVMDGVVSSLPHALGLQKLPRRLLVVGVDTGRQRSAFVTHFARAMEQSGIPTMLVDADLESGRLSRDLGLTRAPGLADCLRSDMLPHEAVVVPEAGMARGLPVLPAGSKLPLRSSSPAVVMAGLNDPERRLIVDAPAPSRGQSLGPLVRNADAVIVLVAAGESSADKTRSLASLIRSLGDAPAAAVLLDGSADFGPATTVPERSRVRGEAAGAANVLS